jgi:endonuclease/exonuclease/phosphatase family metal-dependent hydrolase
VIILALLLGSLPAILARKRLPWKGGAMLPATAAAVIVVVMAGVFAYTLTLPTPVSAAPAGTQLRVATLNLHSGFSLYYGVNLREVVTQIQTSGADVVLLQEVDTGRLINGGVDQAAWLARVLNMRLAYFPTNEGLQGLAILSKLPIVREEGALLTSRSKQTGVQFVQLRAEDGSLLDVYNTQLSLLFFTSTLSIEEQSQDQEAQMSEILAYIDANRSTAGRLVMGGTFNHQPGTKIYQILGQRRFVDPFAGYPVERADTLRLLNQQGIKTAARVDYVWLYCPAEGSPQCVTPIGVNLVVIPYSSHNLAVVEVRLGS